MFGGRGLTRVGAVDATRASTLVTAYESETCKRTHWAKSGDLAISMFSGEYLERLGASLSHLEAIYKAYDDGASAALVAGLAEMLAGKIAVDASERRPAIEGHAGILDQSTRDE